MTKAPFYCNKGANNVIFSTMKHGEALLREAIRTIILEKKKRGGGITPLGALGVLDPTAQDLKIKAALRSQDGDVPSTADDLGISTRMLYVHFDEKPSLERLKNNLQDDAEKDEDEEEENK
jgi:hypothetical protein